MEKYQEHYDKKFYLDKQTGYYISSECPKIRAHRWVWMKVYGKIPKGFQIHHKDENKSNNNISNLQIVTPSQHVRMHMTEERKKKSKEWMGEIRPLTKEWHASEEGRAWHKAHGILGWIKRKEFEIKCIRCGKKAKTKTYHQEFCSNACKSAARRDSGIDDIIVNCIKCGKEFRKNKYSKAKRCSRICR